MKYHFSVLLMLINFCIFATQAPEKAALCAACHGPNGISSNPQWPNIAGQHAKYIIKQLQDIKQGSARKAPTMVGIVAMLNAEDIASLSAYFAKQPLAKGKTPTEYAARGEKIYKTGDSDKNITACIACHGPKGDGNDAAGFPVVSGQNAPYTIEQLLAFKNKIRINDLNHIMQDICSHMSEEDIKAVAYYMQGL